MSIEKGRIANVLESLDKQAAIVFGASSDEVNGIKGTAFRKTEIYVVPNNPTDISFDDFKTTLLKGEDVNDWDRSNGRLFVNEGEKNVAEIVLFPDAASALVVGDEYSNK